MVRTPRGIGADNVCAAWQPRPRDASPAGEAVPTHTHGVDVNARGHMGSECKRQRRTLGLQWGRENQEMLVFLWVVHQLLGKEEVRWEGKLMWTNLEALPPTRCFLQFQGCHVPKHVFPWSSFFFVDTQLADRCFFFPPQHHSKANTQRRTIQNPPGNDSNHPRGNNNKGPHTKNFVHF